VESKDPIDKEVLKEFSRWAEPRFYTTTTQLKRIITTFNLLLPPRKRIDVNVMLFKIRFAEMFREQGHVTYTQAQEIGDACNLKDSQVHMMFYREKGDIINWTSTIDTPHK
jgi:hypothetical protein